MHLLTWYVHESHIGGYKKAIGYTDVDPHEDLVVHFPCVYADTWRVSGTYEGEGTDTYHTYR